MSIQAILAILEKNGWRLCIGDPYPIGWIIFAAYLIASVLCFYVGNSISKSNSINKEKRDIIFWYGLSILLFFLGINKQLDLQTLFTASGRAIAHSQGWYTIRREVQKIFIIGFTFISLFSLIGIGIFFKKQVLKNYYIIIGAIVIVFYVIIRASTFNHIEFIPSGLHTIFSIHTKYIIELLGLLFILYGAIKKLKEIKIKRITG